ncbi:MAG TPA: phosphoribosyltransferase family protein [Allosphingosinicella sp.]|nr:phosphoribosyltransferase family protein [Allosphingosinicella sp.]
MTTSAHPELYYVPYASFLSDLETVARQIGVDGWKPNFLVGVGRGGLVPAAYLSHRTGITMLSVDHSSGEAAFADELLEKLAAKSRDGSRILIVDDINDSGSTIAYLREALTGYGCSPGNIRVAVLVNNLSSKAQVDYAGTHMDRSGDKRWFVFPWEAMATAESIVEDAASVPERLA